MPIRPENLHRYPPDWPQVRARILARAVHRCERCGVPNYAVGARDGDGEFVPLRGSAVAEFAGRGLRYPSGAPISWSAAKALADAANTEHAGTPNACDPDGYRWFVVVLTVAHLNHQPEDCRPENLLALCQRCHLTHDAKHHATNARKTRRARRAVDMFEGDDA